MIALHAADAIKAVLGDAWYLNQPEDIATYAYDGFLPEFEPDAVLVPENAVQISQIMKIANEQNINVIPRGAGTNICGSSVAREGGVIMAFHRMNRILEIDRESMCAVVQPGVINGDLQREVAKYGLLYPPDPASMNVSTIGGNVALNAGGPRGVKYGVTRDYLLGLEVVLPTGEIIRTGGKTLKNVSGYDLTRLFCGSEGTLGILTEMTLRLVPLPPAKTTLQAAYAQLDDAATTVTAILAAGMVPTTLELMDRTVLDVISDYGGARFNTQAQALLLIEVDGDADLVEKQGKQIETLCHEKGAIAVDRAHTPAEADKLWQARRTAFGAVASMRPNCIVEDATVPVKRLPDIIRKVVELTHKYDLQIAVLAHAGDGNLHPLIMTDLRDKEEMKRIDEMLEELCDAAISMGGTLSGEHGIGIAKARFMRMEHSETAINLMRGIKRVFDPNNILNPGSFL